MRLRHDYHVHSTYSDGAGLPWMVDAADEAGLDAVGFADHCNVSEREELVREKYEHGFNLDLTYERRRAAIESVRERTDVTIFDAVELDYDPADEPAIRAFLDEAEFDYAVGSVHRVEGVDVHDREHFAGLSDDTCEGVVDSYYDRLVELVDSELFDIAAHVDLVERTPALRGHTTEDHHEMVADAFERSRTVPEINAGRALDEYGTFHPEPEFLEHLRDRGVPFVPGSDAHRPGELRERVPVLEEYFVDLDLETASPFEG